MALYAAANKRDILQEASAHRPGKFMHFAHFDSTYLWKIPQHYFGSKMIFDGHTLRDPIYLLCFGLGLVLL